MLPLLPILLLSLSTFLTLFLSFFSSHDNLSEIGRNYTSWDRSCEVLDATLTLCLALPWNLSIAVKEEHSLQTLVVNQCRCCRDHVQLGFVTMTTTCMLITNRAILEFFFFKVFANSDYKIITHEDNNGSCKQSSNSYIQTEEIELHTKQCLHCI